MNVTSLKTFISLSVTWSLSLQTEAASRFSFFTGDKLETPDLLFFFSLLCHSFSPLTQPSQNEVRNQKFTPLKQRKLLLDSPRTNALTVTINSEAISLFIWTNLNSFFYLNITILNCFMEGGSCKEIDGWQVHPAFVSLFNCI